MRSPRRRERRVPLGRRHRRLLFAPADSTRTPEGTLRDQFAAFVEERYDHLKVLATVALGAARATELLPSLRSTVAPTPAAKPAPAPAPTPNG
ncbi:MAG: hypothetical protein U0324_04060 [Polyangiales bacterium]